MALFTNDRDDGAHTQDIGKMETIIGPSVKVEGNFDGKGDVIVEGSVTGTLKTTMHLRVGRDAKIKADVDAKSVYAAGEIRGNVRATDRVELTSTARVYGNIETRTLSIESGAVFNGKSVMASEEVHVDDEQSPFAKKQPKQK